MDKLIFGNEMEAINVAAAKVNIMTTTDKNTTSDTIVAEETPVEETATNEMTAEGEVIATGEVVGETTTGEVVGETATEGNEGEVINQEGSMPTETGTTVDPGFDTGAMEVKNPLLSSWVFVIGISITVLFVSVALGVFLAKRKIKKGIELYED